MENCSMYSAYYPDIVVAGNPKCGTSYLWTILSTHPKIDKAHPRKEYCDEKFTAVRQSGHLTLNACIDTAQAVERHKCFGSPTHTKFIFSIRNSADFKWAAYNYWDMATDTIRHEPEHWANSDNYRSAAMFHEGIMADGKIMGFPKLPASNSDFITE
jgi:hypothetical protein